MKHRCLIALFCMLAGLFLVSCLPPTPEPTQTPQPTATQVIVPTATSIFNKSEEYVTAAWNAFNNNQFEEAIAFAQECIDKWESEALQEQAALTQAPPIGTVTDEEEKAIFANWALNDVGTAYYIKALALEKLGRIPEAKEAYEKTVSFEFARCWDPGGFFWAPAEAASENLAKLP